MAIATYERTEHPELLSPMVVSGTHSPDVVMWLLEGKTPGEVYARSVDKVLGPTLRGTDGTFGVITMTDGTISSVGCTWALPAVWPGSVYSLETGIVGTEGVLTIDDTHRGRGPRPPDAHQGHGPLRGKKMRHPAAHYSEGPATVGARAMGAMASSSWVSRGGRG